jgi:uncharacterized protein YutE (UPF0331/DUF86 family)
MVDRDVLSARLSALDSYLRELRGFRSRSEDQYVLESALHVLAERYLHLACEAVVDIALEPGRPSRRTSATWIASLRRWRDS